MDVTETSWGSRMGSSFQNMCCGIITIPICWYIVFWNESNYVKEQATADLIAKATVVEGCNTGNMGKFVYVEDCSLKCPNMYGDLPDVLKPWIDDHFLAATEISWNVQVKQWVQVCDKDSEKTVTGGTRTTVTCHDELQWASSITHNAWGHNAKGQPTIDYEDRSDHNDDNARCTMHGERDGDNKVKANTVSLVKENGVKSFELTDALLNNVAALDHDVLGDEADLSTVTNVTEDAWQRDLIKQAKNTLLWRSGADDQSDLCDMKITLSGRGGDGPYSVVGDEVKHGGSSTFTFHQPETYSIFGGETAQLQEMRPGKLTPEAFIALKKAEAASLVWIIRICCFIGMILGFQCIFQPLSVSADLLMYLNFCTCGLGEILDQAAQAMICMVSCGAGMSCFCMAFILAWLFANPFYAICGLVMMCCLSGAAFYVKSQRKRKDVDAKELVDEEYRAIDA